jgi:hypothetical protein
MDLREIGCEEGRWLKLAQEWWAVVLAVLNLLLVLPEGYLSSKMDLREIGCEERTWMRLAQNLVQWWAVVLAVLNLLLVLPEG